MRDTVSWTGREETEKLRGSSGSGDHNVPQARDAASALDRGPGGGLERSTWGLGRAIEEHFSDTEVVGVDRRGHTCTGSAQGVITSAVNHDFTEGGDLPTAVARKVTVGRSVKQWQLLWISP